MHYISICTTFPHKITELKDYSSKMSKPHVIKDFDKLDLSIREQIKMEYPSGFHENLVTYTDKEGNQRKALPFETEDKVYLVRMTVEEAKQIVMDDEDYDDDGVLKEEVMDGYQDKYSEEMEFEEEEEEVDPYKDKPEGGEEEEEYEEEGEEDEDGDDLDY